MQRTCNLCDCNVELDRVCYYCEGALCNKCATLNNITITYCNDCLYYCCHKDDNTCQCKLDTPHLPYSLVLNCDNCSINVIYTSDGNYPYLCDYCGIVLCDTCQDNKDIYFDICKICGTCSCHGNTCDKYIICLCELT